MILSGIIVSVSFFVGYLMMQRLRQSVLAVDSAQAFYASDSGVELELYRFSKGDLSEPCPVFSKPGVKVLTTISANGDLNTDPALGLEIRSTGCVGDNCAVSRSQMDTSQSLSKARCSDPAEPAGLCNLNPPVTHCKLNG